MLAKLLDKLGEWNPQLFRELKGRLIQRNIFLAVGISVLIQGFMVMFAFQTFNHDVNSKLPWDVIFKVLDIMLPLVLLLGSVSMLMEDLVKEEQRGTLNFIRLSPQSSQDILIGKILGVPSLVYLAIALAIPLHGISALLKGLPFIWLIGHYTIWVAIWVLFNTIALLITVLSGTQADSKALAGGATFITLMLGWPLIAVLGFSFDIYKDRILHGWQWMLLPLGDEPLLAYGWLMVSLSIASYWIWQAVNRRFRNPNSTLLKKQQSYWLVASLQIWLLGFVAVSSNSGQPSYNNLTLGAGFLFFANPLLFLFIDAALSPPRQALLDWSRYRKTAITVKQSFWKSSLLQDLIWNEKSPALVAIAINLLITATIWIPWILIYSFQIDLWKNFPVLQVLIGLVLTMNTILIYCAISELLGLAIPLKRNVNGATIVFLLIFLPFFLMPILSITPAKYPIVWMFSIFPAMSLAIAPLTLINTLVGFLGQLSLIVFLSSKLTQKLQKAGESSSKELFANSSILPNKTL